MENRSIRQKVGWDSGEDFQHALQGLLLQTHLCSCHMNLHKENTHKTMSDQQTKFAIVYNKAKFSFKIFMVTNSSQKIKRNSNLSSWPEHSIETDTNQKTLNRSGWNAFDFDG